MLHSYTDMVINSSCTALQIQLTQLPSLPPSLESTSNAQKELTLASASSVSTEHGPLVALCSFLVSLVLHAGDTLELAVFMSVKLKDEAAFERNYQQLQMYTSDTRHVSQRC